MLNRLSASVLVALGLAAAQAHAPAAMASPWALLAQSKAASTPADDGHDHAVMSDLAAAGVLDEATVNSMRAAPLPKQIRAEVSATVQKLAASAQVR